MSLRSQAAKRKGLLERFVGPVFPSAPVHPLDERINADLDFPMSGDGTADGDILAEAVPANTDLNVPMGGDSV